jgi:hypothetical protein
MAAPIFGALPRPRHSFALLVTGGGTAVSNELVVMVP